MKLDFNYSQYLNLKSQELLYKEKAKDKKKELNKEFIKENKTSIRILDCMIIGIFILNVIAFFITNSLIFKENPEPEFYEANPIASKVYNFEDPPEEKRAAFNLSFISFMIMGLIWAMFLYSYYWARSNIVNNLQLWTFCFCVVCFVIPLFFDFIKNISLLTGKLIWGA